MKSRQLGLGLFTLAMVAVFIGLGAWQLQRRIEKHALIAALNERLAAEPISLPPSSQWGTLKPDADEFRRVHLTAIYLDMAAAARVYSSGSAVRDDVSGPGTWEFVPAVLPSGEMIAVNIGFAQEVRREASSEESKFTKFVVRTPVELTGYLRFPERKNALTPAADVGRRLWFLRDHLDMANVLHWNSAVIAPFYVDLELPVLAEGLFKPGPLHVHLKDDHLQYAVTWFALALAVSIAFLVWLRGHQRT